MRGIAPCPRRLCGGWFLTRSYFEDTLADGLQLTCARWEEPQPAGLWRDSPGQRPGQALAIFFSRVRLTLADRYVQLNTHLGAAPMIGTREEVVAHLREKLAASPAEDFSPADLVSTGAPALD